MLKITERTSITEMIFPNKCIGDVYPDVTTSHPPSGC